MLSKSGKKFYHIFIFTLDQKRVFFNFFVIVITFNPFSHKNFCYEILLRPFEEIILTDD